MDNEDSDLNADSNAEYDPDNNPKLKIILVISSIILIGELIYFTKFSGIKIPIKFPELSFVSLIRFVDSLNPSPTPTPTSTPTPTPTLKREDNDQIKEYQGKIILFDNSTNSANEEELYFNTSYSPDGKIKIIKDFFYNKSDLNFMKVINSNGEIISYKDLKVGQNIRITQKYGLSEAPHSSIEINILE